MKLNVVNMFGYHLLNVSDVTHVFKSVENPTEMLIVKSLLMDKVYFLFNLMTKSKVL